MKVTSAADEASDTQHETITPDTGQSNLGRDLHSERWNIFRSSREPQKNQWCDMLILVLRRQSFILYVCQCNRRLQNLSVES